MHAEKSLRERQTVEGNEERERKGDRFEQIKTMGGNDNELQCN